MLEYRVAPAVREPHVCGLAELDGNFIAYLSSLTTIIMRLCYAIAHASRQGTGKAHETVVSVLVAQLMCSSFFQTQLVSHTCQDRQVRE
jgi:hypothetical protein